MAVAHPYRVFTELYEVNDMRTGVSDYLFDGTRERCCWEWDSTSCVQFATRLCDWEDQSPSWFDVECETWPTPWLFEVQWLRRLTDVAQTLTGSVATTIESS